MLRVIKGVFLISFFAASSLPAAVNLWINSADSVWKWEASTNWSLGVPNGTHTSFITNGASGTGRRYVAIDATTQATIGGLFVVSSNLTVGTMPGNITLNELDLSNTGTYPLNILKDLAILSRGTIRITNATLRCIDGAGGVFPCNGNLFMNTGTIETFQAFGPPALYIGVRTVLGTTGTGQLYVNGGRLKSGPLQLGSSISTLGTFTVGSGSVTIQNIFTGGTDVLAIKNGTAWFIGGDTVISGQTTVGSIASGNGNMVVSNVTVKSQNVFVGLAGGTGTLTVGGGALDLTDYTLNVGHEAGSAGYLWLNGNLSSTFLRVGYATAATATISNGVVNTVFMSVGALSGSTGILNVNGGNTYVSSAMGLGNNNCSANGYVYMNGGQLSVTNSGFATLEVLSGSINLSGGTLTVDRLVITNSCGHFAKTGGTLICTNIVLDPNGDTDGDGLPNGYEQSHGTDPLNPAEASLDTDGDGFTNGQEVQLHTDPLAAASAPRILNFVKDSVGVTITYQGVRGFVNEIQKAIGTPGYNTNFSFIGSASSPGSGVFTGTVFNSGNLVTNRAIYYRLHVIVP